MLLVAVSCCWSVPAYWRTCSPHGLLQRPSSSALGLSGLLSSEVSGWISKQNHSVLPLVLDVARTPRECRSLSKFTSLQLPLLRAQGPCQKVVAACLQKAASGNYLRMNFGYPHSDFKDIFVTQPHLIIFPHKISTNSDQASPCPSSLARGEVC